MLHIQSFVQQAVMKLKEILEDILYGLPDLLLNRLKHNFQRFDVFCFNKIKFTFWCKNF
jgi:hypothetical protein